MFVKDTQGQWYEVDEAVVKSKKLEPDKAREALIAARAEKRKKIIDLLSTLDQDDIEILHDKLIDRGGYFPGRIECIGPRPDCTTRPQCIGPRPECIGPRPDCIGINWGTSGGHPACDCKGGHPACDCRSIGERTYGLEWKVRR